ncbi:uncharacterized protein IWZ02DRAFT_135780 [Phyllosticta citriasiana]|uniref:Uncharacterized protein n=1 Tax=Phyllosticta citriasiana TaxID=595635 RepID=A0ABR1KU59_9PEZI
MSGSWAHQAGHDLSRGWLDLDENTQVRIAKCFPMATFYCLAEKFIMTLLYQRRLCPSTQPGLLDHGRTNLIFRGSKDSQCVKGRCLQEAVAFLASPRELLVRRHKKHHVERNVPAMQSAMHPADCFLRKSRFYCGPRHQVTFARLVCVGFNHEIFNQVSHSMRTNGLLFLGLFISIRPPTLESKGNGEFLLTLGRCVYNSWWLAKKARNTFLLPPQHAVAVLCLYMLSSSRS